jgi:hypothetical protein
MREAAGAKGKNSRYLNFFISLDPKCFTVRITDRRMNQAKTCNANAML